MKPRILFVCSLRGARSRIAEAFARLDAGDLLNAHSACFEPCELKNGLPFTVMDEAGVDLKKGTCASVFDRYRDGERYDYVVTLCAGATSAVCPLFSRNIDTLYAKTAERIAWQVPDFMTLAGKETDRLEGARMIRDEIRTLVRDLALRIQSESSSGHDPSEAVGEA